MLKEFPAWFSCNKNFNLLQSSLRLEDKSLVDADETPKTLEEDFLWDIAKDFFSAFLKHRLSIKVHSFSEFIQRFSIPWTKISNFKVIIGFHF